MARPKKNYLDYYPKDVIELGNRKIRRLLKKHDAQGYLIYEYLLMLIYGSNGYFLNIDDDLSFDISDYLPVDISENLVEEVLKTCLELDLFDNKMYQKEQILTSFEVQKNFVIARKGKNEVIKKYIVFDKLTGVLEQETIVNDAITPVSDSITPKNSIESAQKKRKENKREEKKIKENKIYGGIRKKENPHENEIRNNFIKKDLNNLSKKEPLSQKEKSSAKKEKENNILEFKECKAFFLEKSITYYWQNEDDIHLEVLLKKLRHLIQQTGTKQNLIQSFRYYIQNLPQYWKEKKCTMPLLSKNYNEIINEIKQNYEYKQQSPGQKRTQELINLAKNFAKDTNDSDF